MLPKLNLIVVQTQWFVWYDVHIVSLKPIPIQLLECNFFRATNTCLRVLCNEVAFEAEEKTLSFEIVKTLLRNTGLLFLWQSKPSILYYSAIIYELSEIEIYKIS